MGYVYTGDNEADARHGVLTEDEEKAVAWVIARALEAKKSSETP